MLLKELEEARGRRVHLDISQDDQNVTCSEISSSSMVISDKLVTFRSVVITNNCVLFLQLDVAKNRKTWFWVRDAYFQIILKCSL